MFPLLQQLHGCFYRVLKNYESLKNLRSNQKQKESTQNLLQKKNENSFREQKVSVFSSMTKRSSPRLIITVLLGTNAKRNTNNTIITELRKCEKHKTERKRIDSLGCLPTSAIV